MSGIIGVFVIWRMVAYLIDARIFPPNSLMLGENGVVRHCFKDWGQCACSSSKHAPTNVSRNEHRKAKRVRVMDFYHAGFLRGFLCYAVCRPRHPNRSILRAPTTERQYRGSGGDGAKLPLICCRQRAELGTLSYCWRSILHLAKYGCSCLIMRDPSDTNLDAPLPREGVSLQTICEARNVPEPGLVGPTRK